MSLGISAQCNVSFASFWDLGPRVDPSENATEAAMLALADHALAFAAKGRLFNADATATLLVASVSACGGTPVTMRCASDPNGYCAPIAQLSQRLKDYAARANGQATGLRLQVLPPVDSAVYLGGPQLPATIPWPPGLALWAVGYATHSGRAVAPPRVQWEAAVRALGPGRSRLLSRPCTRQVVDLTLALTPTRTLTQVVDFGDINDAIKTGIDQTMALSTLSMPLALAVLGFMLRNVWATQPLQLVPSLIAVSASSHLQAAQLAAACGRPPRALRAAARRVHPLRARASRCACCWCRCCASSARWRRPS